mmetsp:Transcript_13376/g.48705  ORF Transcript_13376/g.48705 Transcript_13376/m.48705 type:complete len:87 (-) Transcript_13376:680-940(-)|eukprot:scaffold237_cov421-Prasinococcus_capsulatus_cf.AAC.22
MPLGVEALANRARHAAAKGFLRLTSKRGNKNYYKGKGAASTGKHTSKGGYRLLASKLPVFNVPDLTDFPLKPYVSLDKLPGDRKQT